MKNIINFLSGIAGELLIAVIILVITSVTNKIINSAINRVIKKRKNKELTTVLLFVRKIKTYIIYTIGVLLALNSFSVFSTFSVTILSTIGIAAGVIGISAQDGINNLLGSLELIISKPFQVGDYITVKEVPISGTVEEITFRHTILKTINNQRDIIPNSVLNRYTIENFDFIDNDIVLFADYSVAYNSDLDKVISVTKEEIVKVCKDKYKNNEDIEYPKVRVVALDNSCIKIRAWVWGEDVGVAYDNLFALNHNLKVRFDKEKIEIPYDSLNVIMKK